MEGGEEGGEVVAIPNRKLCSNCEHGALSTSGVFCTFFREPIFDERVAVDCGEFDPQPVSQPAQPPAAAPEPESTNDRLSMFLEGTELEELVDRHLQRSYSTLWGEAFDVKSDRGRAAAVAWLAAEIRELVGGDV